MEQLVILIIIGLISFVNWLLQRAAKARAMRQHELRGEPRAPEIDLPFDVSDEDVVPGSLQPSAEETRRFLEALGLPSDRERPVERKVAPQPQLPAAVQPTKKVIAKPAVQESRVIDEKVQKLAIKFRSAEHKQPVQIYTDVDPGNLRSFLRSSNGIKQAMIFREILGPPKGIY